MGGPRPPGSKTPKNMKKKTKQTLLISLGAVLFIASLVWLASISENSSPAVAKYSQGSLSGSGQDYDFGTIVMDRGNVEHEYKVKNESAEPVVITKVYTSCMCTYAIIIDPAGKQHGSFGMPGHGKSPFTEIALNPGEEATVRAVFDPAAHGPSGVGLAQRSVYVETNSAQSPKMEFSFSAMVTR